MTVKLAQTGDTTADCSAATSVRRCLARARADERQAACIIHETLVRTLLRLADEDAFSVGGRQQLQAPPRHDRLFEFPDPGLPSSAIFSPDLDQLM